MGFAAVQEVPSYSSVFPLSLGLSLPKAKAAVCVPNPVKLYLAVFKLLLAVQEEPSYSSVEALFENGGVVAPPKATPEVCVPAPSKIYLDVFKFPPADHPFPLYSSVKTEVETGEPVAPPKAIDASLSLPEAPNVLLAVAQDEALAHASVTNTLLKVSLVVLYQI
jgi:hypothetical protein